MLKLLAAILVAWGGWAPVTDEAEFHDGLEHVDRLASKERWSQAQEELLELLGEHDGADYVLAEVARVAETLRRLRFRSEHEVPDVETLISGDLMSYDDRSGKIKVRYKKDKRAEPETYIDDEGNEREFSELLQLLGLTGVGGAFSSDFTYLVGAPVHPLHFSGPFTVEIKGEFPDDDDGLAWFGSPRFLVGIQDGDYYDIQFGMPRWKGFALRTGAIHHIEDGRPRRLDDASKPVLKYGKSYKIKVVVGNDSITATANGKSVLKCDKPDDVFGQFGFSGCPRVSEMTITGTANTAWLEGLMDAAEQSAWAEFTENDDPLADLPEWLHEHVASGEVVAATRFDISPGKPGPVDQSHREKLQAWEQKGEWDEALEFLDGMKPHDASKAFQEWNKGLVKAAMGRFGEALEHIETVLVLDKAFLPAKVQQSSLMLWLGREEEALELARGLAAEHPDAALAQESLARQLVYAGDLPGAQQVVDDAMGRGIPGAELAGINAMLHRVRSGPDWTGEHEYTSRNYLVRTDLSDRAAADVGRILEQSLAMYQRLFGRDAAGDTDTDRYRVFLFSGQAGYLMYTGELFGSPAHATAGVYSPNLDQLAIWNLPDEAAMHRTVRHEGLHQYLDRMLPTTPIWFNEGLAEYMETAELERGTMTPGAPVQAHARMLTESDQEWTDYSELLRMRPYEFRQEVTRHYAQSWALVHYLLHSGRDDRELFDDYFAALAGGSSALEAADEVFGDVDMDSLQRKVKNHLRGFR